MSDPTGEHAQAFQLLSPQHVSLHALALGVVESKHEAAGSVHGRDPDDYRRALAVPANVLLLVDARNGSRTRLLNSNLVELPVFGRRKIPQMDSARRELFARKAYQREVGVIGLGNA